MNFSVKNEFSILVIIWESPKENMNEDENLTGDFMRINVPRPSPMSFMK